MTPRRGGVTRNISFYDSDQASTGADGRPGRSNCPLVFTLKNCAREF